MLLHHLLQGPKTPAPGRVARVSFSFQNAFGAVAAGEVRSLPIAAPGGYRYRPREEEQLLLLDTQDGTVALGTMADSTELAPGEIRISGPAGSYLHFCADGTVVINGTAIGPDGTVTPPASKN